MKPIPRLIRSAALGAALFAQAALATATGPGFVASSSIPAPDGRWDFASWDAEHARLLVAHGNDVLVIDPSGAEPPRAIGALEGAHGVVAIAGTGQVVVTSGRDNTVRVLDFASGAEVARIPVAENPDAVVLSASGRMAFVMAAKAGAISLVDLVNHTEVGRIALNKGLEVPVLVTPGLLAVNNEDASEIEFANLLTRKADGRIVLTGCEAPTGLAYAPALGLALSTCANGKAALVDLRARRLVGLVPIGLGPDTAIWDARHARFLVPCGKSGTLSVIRMVGRKPVVEQSVVTETSARTAALDPASGRLYLPAAQFSPATEPGKRPSMVAGSFHIVVMAPFS